MRTELPNNSGVNTIMIPELSYLDWRDSFWHYAMIVVSSYPDKPSQVLRKKVYRFFTDIPAMMPDQEFRHKYTELLSRFPVSPYLDSRNDLSKWITFFRNRIGETYNEKTVTEPDMWKEYSDSLGPTPAQQPHHPKWYALVTMVTATLILLLFAYSGEGRRTSAA